MFIASHVPGSGCRGLLVCVTGKHPHYSLFPPINNGQWYVVGLRGNTSAEAGGRAPLWTLVTPAWGNGGWLAGWLFIV
jgi:hypothetical protein